MAWIKLLPLVQYCVIYILDSNFEEVGIYWGERHIEVVLKPLIYVTKCVVGIITLTTRNRIVVLNSKLHENNVSSAYNRQSASQSYMIHSTLILTINVVQETNLKEEKKKKNLCDFLIVYFNVIIHLYFIYIFPFPGLPICFFTDAYLCTQPLQFTSLLRQLTII